MEMDNTTRKTYVIDNLKQLIDINGDTVNFEADFVVSNKEGREFEMLVVDQTTLDNSEKLDYKKVKGQISGKVRSDKNVYQNYFLILKSEKPIELDVTINKVEVQPAESRVTLKETPTPKQKKEKTNWLFILCIVVIALVAAFLFYKFVWCKNSTPKMIVRPSFEDRAYTDNDWKWENRRSRREKTRIKFVSPSSSPELSVRSNSDNERGEKSTRKMKKEVVKSPQKVNDDKVSEREDDRESERVPDRVPDGVPEIKIEKSERVPDRVPEIESERSYRVENSSSERKTEDKPILKPILNQRVSYNRETLLSRLRNISALKHETDE